MGTGRLVLIRYYANMMPAFYANSVLIHLNDTGEISHEIGEAAFVSETIKIIQGFQAASLMETWLTVWYYKCSPNGIFTVCPTPSNYLCQWFLLLAAGRAARQVRRRPAPASAPQQSLSLCWGSESPLGFAGDITRERPEQLYGGQSQLPRGCWHFTLEGGTWSTPSFLWRGHEQSWALWKCMFPKQGCTFTPWSIVPQNTPRREKNRSCLTQHVAFIFLFSTASSPCSPIPQTGRSLLSQRTCIKSLKTIAKLHAQMLWLLVKLRLWEALLLLSLCSPGK